MAQGLDISVTRNHRHTASRSIGGQKTIPRDVFSFLSAELLLSEQFPQQWTFPSLAPSECKEEVALPTQCLSVGPGPGTQSVAVPQQGQLLAGALTRHLNAWRQVTDDYISLQAIVGVKIPLLGKPPVRRASKAELDERRVDPVIDEAVKVVSTQAVLVSLINSLQ